MCWYIMDASNRAPHIIDNDYSQSRLLIYGQKTWDCFGYNENTNFAAPLTAVALQQFETLLAAV